MSQTPLTDSEAYDVGGEQHPQGSVVSAKFARELEKRMAQSEKSNLNLRAFISELESHQQGLLNELDAIKHRCAEPRNSKSA